MPSNFTDLSILSIFQKGVRSSFRVRNIQNFSTISWFSVQIFSREICVHAIPSKKSVTLHVLYSYYSTEMHKTGVSYRGCVSMILGKVRGNTVRTSGMLLPFGQNCGSSCNVNTEIPIEVSGNPKGFPVIKLQSKMSQRQGLHCVFSKFLTQKLSGTPTWPVVGFLWFSQFRPNVRGLEL